MMVTWIKNDMINYNKMFLGYIFDAFSSIIGAVVLVFILAHLITNLFFKKKPLKLDKNSFVVITGACQGIGRQMALEIAKLYHCSILVVDIKKELFDKIAAEISEAGGTCECRHADLSNDASVKELIDFLL